MPLTLYADSMIDHLFALFTMLSNGINSPASEEQKTP